MNKVRQFWAKPFNQILTFAVVLVLSLGVLMNYLFSKPTLDQMRELGLSQQLLAARAGAVYMETYLETLGGVIESQGREPVIAGFGDEARENLVNRMNYWPDTAWSETILVDAKGIIRVIANRQGVREGEGLDISDREYFKEAIGQTEGYITERTIVPRGGANQGQFVFSVAAPIRVDGVTMGVIHASILISELTKNSFDHLRLPETSEIYLIRKDGMIMFTNENGLRGQSVYELLANGNKFFGSQGLDEVVHTKLMEGQEGTLRLLLPTDEKVTSIEQKLIAYAPVNLGKQDECGCLMAVVVPEKEVLLVPAEMYVRQVFISVLAFLAMMIFAVRVAKSIGYYEGRSSR